MREWAFNPRTWEKSSKRFLRPKETLEPALGFGLPNNWLKTGAARSRLRATRNRDIAGRRSSSFSRLLNSTERIAWAAVQPRRGWRRRMRSVGSTQVYVSDDLLCGQG